RPPVRPARPGRGAMDRRPVRRGRRRLVGRPGRRQRHVRGQVADKSDRGATDTKADYADAARTADDYDTTVGGPGTTAAFLAAALTSLATPSDGSVVATYTAAAPHAAWRTGDRGRYSVVVDGTVKDADGFPLADDQVARVNLSVQKVPPPPTVKKVKFRDKAP